MLEALAVLGVVGLLAVGGLLAPFVSGDAVLALGALLVALGMLVGVPTGTWYHVVLHRQLRACTGEALPARWWLHPTAYHDRLEPRDLRPALLWFRIGGAGFGVTVLGCIVAVAGLALG